MDIYLMRKVCLGFPRCLALQSKEKMDTTMEFCPLCDWGSEANDKRNDGPCTTVFWPNR